jgi:hypothetical protein
VVLVARKIEATPEMLEEARAKVEVYRDRLIQLWGPNYAQNYQYPILVEEVAGGRYPHMAIGDRFVVKNGV